MKRKDKTLSEEWLQDSNNEEVENIIESSYNEERKKDEEKKKREEERYNNKIKLYEIKNEYVDILSEFRKISFDDKCVIIKMISEFSAGFDKLEEELYGFKTKLFESFLELNEMRNDEKLHKEKFIQYLKYFENNVYIHELELEIKKLKDKN